MRNFFFNMILSFIFLAGLAGFMGCRESKDTVDRIGENVVFGTQDRANLLKLQKDMQTMSRAIEVFQASNGRFPESLDELAQKGIIHKIPREPFGGEWNYDPSTGKVTSSSHPQIDSSGGLQ